jgi:hypothetical protein
LSVPADRLTVTVDGRGWVRRYAVTVGGIFRADAIQAAPKRQIVPMTPNGPTMSNQNLIWLAFLLDRSGSTQSISPMSSAD